MAPLSFLKSSSSTASSAQAAPSPSRSSSQVRGGSPSPEPSSTSRYNPARLLRRKASLSHKSSSSAVRTSASTDGQPPVPALIAASEHESSEHETEGPRTASSAFFSDIGDPPNGTNIGLGLRAGGDGRGYATQAPGFVGEDGRLKGAEDGPSRTFGSPRSKRDGGIWSGGGTVLMDSIPDFPPTQPQSPSQPKFVDQTTPTTPSSRRIIDPAELFLDDTANTRFSPGSSRLLRQSVTPPVPPLDHPFYPTALSPPRRPMPKSPQPSSRSTPPPQPPQLVSSSSFSAFPPNADRPRHVPSPSLDGKAMSHQDGTVSASASSSGTSGNGLIVDLQDDMHPVMESESRRPTVTAEWLARKPSKLGRKNSSGAEKVTRSSVLPQAQLSSPISKRRTPQRTRSFRQAYIAAQTAGTDSDSPSLNQDSDADNIPGIGSAGLVGKRTSLSVRDGYEVEVSCDDSQWPGPEDEAGELVWHVKIRRQPKPSQTVTNINEQPGAKSSTPATVAPSSPLQLSSTGHSRATAPATASSINLSLSLDQPTGKLVFIAFPMDLHATPRRRSSKTTADRRLGGGPPTPPLPPSPRDLFSAGASTSTSAHSNTKDHSDTPGLAEPFAQVADISAPPSTPPQPPLAAQPSTPQSRSSSRLDRPEYPVTPTRVRLSGQFSPGHTGSGAFTSPRSRGSNPSIARSLSPAFSGGGTPGSIGQHNGYISPGTYAHGTPTSSSRRMKLVSAPDLEGGLYAPGTVDGLSEELESSSLSPR